MASPNRNFSNAAIFTQTSSGTTPNSGDTSLFVKSDNELYTKNSAGTEAQVAPVKSVAGRSGDVILALSDLTQSGAATNQVPAWNGTAWVPQTPSGGGGGAANNLYANGYWICPNMGTLGAGASMNANNIYLYPFTVERAITVGELGARVTTGVAASSVQLAIYASSAGEPNGAPLASTVSLSGVTATTISDNVTDFNLAEKTTYWMAVNSNAAITMQHLTGAAQLAAAYVIGSTTLANISAGSTNSGGWRSVAQTFGTWPTLAASGTTVQTGSPRGGLVFLQISALL
jgi:hypothetical protein